MICSTLDPTSTANWQQDIETDVAQFNANALHLLTKHCRPPAPEAKKPFFDETLWALRVEKNSCRRVLKTVCKVYRSEVLRTYLQAWTQSRRPVELHASVTFSQAPEHWNYRVTLQCDALLAAGRFYNKNLCTKKNLKSAKKLHVQKYIDQLPPGASAADILAGLRPCIGTSNMRKRKGASLPHVLDAQGRPCRTQEETVNRWSAFFCDMEGGTKIDLAQQRQLWLDGLARELPTELDVPLDELPTLLELEQSLRRVKDGKTTGHDDIPSEFCHHHPGPVARCIFLQVWKLFLRGQEALVHKGGQLVAAYKRGNRGECSSYRSLLISTHLGKAIHRTLRQKQMTIYTGYMQHQQLGGRPKISVSMACHICRAYQRWQRDCGRNYGFLFLDLTEAFYRALRPLALGGQWNDETIAKMAQRLRLPDDVLADLRVKLQEPHSLELAGAPSHHQRYIRSLHQDTFFYVDGQTDICRTELGSRPGDSFADIIFGYLWARLLRQLQDDLQLVGLLEVVSQPTVLGLNGQHSSTELPLLGPTWCDDLAVVGTADSPNAIVSKMGTIASYLLDHCEAMALTPNLKRGKTEILFGFAGKNSRTAKRTHFIHDNGGWLPVICSHRTVQLHITGEYQHLGGLLHHGGDQRKEMKRRLAMAHVSFGEHRKLLFQNRDFPLERRFQLFRTLVLSKLVYGMESWILRTDKSRFILHCAIISLYRRLLRAAPDAHLTDDDICSQLGAVSPTVLLRVQRLRYLGLVYKTAGADLWAIFLHDKVWVELIRADLRWMYLQLHHSSSLKDPDIHLEEWEHILRQYPGYWKRLVNRAGEHSVLQMRRKNDIERSLQNMAEALRLDDFVEVSSDDPAPEEISRFGCMLCQKACKSKAGEGAHMFRCHKKVNPIRSLAQSATCDACLRHYHTTSRLVAHLRYSKSCRLKLLGRGGLGVPLPGAGSAFDAEMTRQHDGLLPFLQAEGPNPVDAPPGDDFLMYDLELYTAIGEQLVDLEGVTCLSTIRQKCRQLLTAQAVSWTECRATIIQFLTDNEGHVEAFDFDTSPFLAVLREFQRSEAWAFLQDFTPKTAHRDCSDWDSIFGAATPLWTSGGPRFRSFGRHRYVLHLFAGRRRPGDVEFYMRQRPPDDGVVLHVVSLDVVIDDKWGNLLSAEVRTFWLAGIRQGFVVGLLSGPPCETWSRARGRQLTGPQQHHGEGAEPRRGPRILRDVSQLWGFDCVGLKECKQLIFGNSLLLFTLEAVIALLLSGGSAIVEHPACPEQADLASIWRLKVIRFLAAQAEVALVHLAQGMFGAPSPKPTTLLALRVPDLQANLDRCKLRQTMPQGTSIGLDEKGEFKTSILKEYPPALCCALGTALCDAVNRYHLDPETEAPPPDFCTVAARMELREYGANMGRDFMGG